MAETAREPGMELFAFVRSATARENLTFAVTPAVQCAISFGLVVRSTDPVCAMLSCISSMFQQTSFHSTGEASKGDGTADPRRPGTEICSYTMSSTADSHVVGDTRSPYRAVLFSDVIVGEALEVAVGGDTPTEVKGPGSIYRLATTP